MLIKQNSTFAKPDVRATRLHEIKRKVVSRNITAVSAAMENIESGSVVQVMNGPGAGLTLIVKHVWKGTLWGESGHERYGYGSMVAALARNCRILEYGPNGPGAGGRGGGPAEDADYDMFSDSELD